MPARGLAPAPREYLSNADWPDGELCRGAPFEAQKVLEISRRLKLAVGGKSLRKVATETGVSVGTLSNLLTGKSWGDVVTLARLERALHAELWASPIGEARAFDISPRRTLGGPTAVGEKQ